MPIGRDVAKLGNVLSSAHRLSWILAGCVAVACSLNPQPDLPLDPQTSLPGSGGSHTGGAKSTAGSGPDLSLGGTGTGASAGGAGLPSAAGGAAAEAGGAAASDNGGAGAGAGAEQAEAGTAGESALSSGGRE